jgi:hypothetical protein
MNEILERMDVIADVVLTTFLLVTAIVWVGPYLLWKLSTGQRIGL